MSPWKTLNTPIAPPSTSETPLTFTLRAPPSTDIWESPTSNCSFNAPIVYQSMKLGEFKRARITLTADFQETFSQGGLVMVIHCRDGNTRWIKTGLEFIRGQRIVGTVGKDQWPDWSGGSVVPEGMEGSEVTVEMARLDLHLAVVEINGGEGGEERKVIREIDWVFAGNNGDEECWVGVYAAKPGGTGSDLVVSFSGLIIEKI